MEQASQEVCPEHECGIWDVEFENFIKKANELLDEELAAPNKTHDLARKMLRMAVNVMLEMRAKVDELKRELDNAVMKRHDARQRAIGYKNDLAELRKDLQAFVTRIIKQEQ